MYMFLYCYIYIFPTLYDLSGTQSTNSQEETEPLTQDEIETLISKQEVRVTLSKRIEQDKYFKTLYPDLLQVVIFNYSEYDVRNAKIAIVAYDKNNLPVLLKSANNILDEKEYLKIVSWDAINLIAGGNVGNDKGYAVSEDTSKSIITVRAIVVSYETFDGKTWKNPYYEDWKEAFVGKKLEK